MLRRAVVVSCLTLLAALVAAGPAPAQQPKRGGVLRIAEREAPGLDPHISISFLTHSYVSLAYSQLVRFPNGPEQKSPTDFSILPDLAEKWEVNGDATEFTFHLRKPSVLLGFGQRRPRRWVVPAHRETGPVIEQDQKGLAAARCHERNHLDADLARIETDVAA